MNQLRARLDDHATYDAFLLAHQRASKNKRNRSEVLKFELNRDRNLFTILDVVKHGEYHPSKYWLFWVTDPKKRLILALPYVDRIIHQWFVEEFIKPYYIPRFIADSYACIPGRGSHAAVAKIQKYMRTMNRLYNGHYYIMKMDIAKFFPNINLEILYQILARVVVDPKLLNLIERMLFDDGEHEGLPIGNYISQYFANIYLNELDQYCKNVLKIRYYVRYMDDFVALAPNRVTARSWFSQINQFVNEQLDMKLNIKSMYWPTGTERGLDFVGYRLYNDFRLLRRRSKKKIVQIIDDFENGTDSVEKFIQRANAWHGHVMHADSHRLVKRYLGDYAPILPVVFPPAIGQMANVEGDVKLDLGGNA